MKTKNQEIQEELKANNSFLETTSRKMPYVVPVDFFPENEIELATIIKLKNKSSDEMPYSVPKDYFNNLKINSTITEEAKTRKLPWEWNMSSMAASLIFALLCYSFFTYKKEPTTSLALSTLPTEDIQQYLIQNDVSIENLDRQKSIVPLEDINDEIISEFLNELH